jgi:hypothetical protein
MLLAASAAIVPWAAGRTPRARDPEGEGELVLLLAGAGGFAAAPDPLVLEHATNVPATARAAVAPASSRMAPTGIRVVMSFL